MTPIFKMYLLLYHSSKGTHYILSKAPYIYQLIFFQKHYHHFFYLRKYSIFYHYFKYLNLISTSDLKVNLFIFLILALAVQLTHFNLKCFYLDAHFIFELLIFIAKDFLSLLKDFPLIFLNLFRFTKVLKSQIDNYWVPFFLLFLHLSWLYIQAHSFIIFEDIQRKLLYF